MADSITLSAASRANLLSLQSTTTLIGKTQQRLSTGLKVASALDDASAYFTAKSLTNRASDLSAIKNQIDQAVSTVQNAVQAIDSATAIINQIQGIAQSAKSATTATDRSTLGNQAELLAVQLNNLINDASYNGVNLLKATPDNLQVNFNEDATIELTIAGTALTASNLGADISTVSNHWGTVGDINADINEYASALGQLRTASQTFGSNATLLQTRLDFTTTLVNTLQTGSDKLTLADLNQEGANLLALQTRQQLGINALSLASQSQSAILSLFR